MRDDTHSKDDYEPIRHTESWSQFPEDVEMAFWFALGF